MKESIFYKPFMYKVENKIGKLEDYSGTFSTKEEAQQWYSKQGKWLENHFKRELILTEETRQINLFTNILDYVSSALPNR